MANTVGLGEYTPEDMVQELEDRGYTVIIKEKK